MARLILDTNIVVDFLKGEPQATPYVRNPAGADISVITWIEVMAGAKPGEELELRNLLAGFRVLQLTPRVAAEAAAIRRASRIKLPDAVILATAKLAGARLVTRNTKDFRSTDPDVLIPYQL